MKVERGKGLFLRSGLGGCFQQPTGMLFCWAFPAFQNAACGVPVWGHLSCAHQTMLMPSKGWGCQHPISSPELRRGCQAARLGCRIYITHSPVLLPKTASSVSACLH